MYYCKFVFTVNKYHIFVIKIMQIHLMAFNLELYTYRNTSYSLHFLDEVFI